MTHQRATRDHFGYAGVDEAGRGPLAGPVIAAAVILHPQDPIAGLADSKTLSPAQRILLCEHIQRRAVAWAVGRAEVAEIDALNILQATFLAMRRAVASLGVTPPAVWVDGNRSTNFGVPTRAIIKGDATVPAISAASIVAKVTRDREMVALEAEYPGYGFALHKGYGTALHLAALQALGATPVHRRSFAPVRNFVVMD